MEYSSNIVTKFFLAENRDSLLSGRWKYPERYAHPTTGHCYIASEALFHLTGGILKPKVATFVYNGKRATHWWLEDEAGHIFDPTEGQHAGNFPFYKIGRGCGFLTKIPSIRSRKIIAWVEEYVHSRL